MIKSIIQRYLPKNILMKYNKAISKTYNIVTNPSDVFEKVYKVKGTTWEDTYYPECASHCKEQHLQVLIPEEYIYYTKNGVVNVDSDVVITDKGVYWCKYNQEEFVTWAKPADKNVIWYDGDKHIGIRKAKRQEYIAGKVINISGLWSYHWAHCMYEFLPKLFTAGEAGLLNQSIIVLIAENEDKTIMEIINNYLLNFPQTKIKYAERDVDYTCEELYFQPIPGSCFSDHNFRLDYPFYISRHVLDKTKKYVVDPIVEKIKENRSQYDKIFLSRKSKYTNTGQMLKNQDEVISYFKQQGFTEIEGSLLTLEQKADIFYHAKEIVGLYGSAWLNVIFCNKANCMVFTNYKMSTDTSLYLQIRDHVNCLINVTGQDDSIKYHSNYYIPLEKIKKVYKEYIQH